MTIDIEELTHLCGRINEAMNWTGRPFSLTVQVGFAGESFVLCSDEIGRLEFKDHDEICAFASAAKSSGGMNLERLVLRRKLEALRREAGCVARNISAVQQALANSEKQDHAPKEKA